MHLRVQYFLIAEFVREGPDGKVDLLGVFDRVTAATVPAAHSQLSVVAFLVCDTEDGLGKHKLQWVFASPSKTRLLSAEGTFVVKPAAGTWLGSARLQWTVTNVPLHEYGKYSFSLDIDGETIATHPLSVVRPEAKR